MSWDSVVESGLLMTQPLTLTHSHVRSHARLHAQGDLVPASLPSFCSPSLLFLSVFLFKLLSERIWMLEPKIPEAALENLPKNKRLQDYRGFLKTKKAPKSQAKGNTVSGSKLRKLGSVLFHLQ